MIGGGRHVEGYVLIWIQLPLTRGAGPGAYLMGIHCPDAMESAHASFAACRFLLASSTYLCQLAHHLPSY